MNHDHNRRAWDQRVKRQQRFTQPAADRDFVDPLATVDGPGWLGGDICGRRLLCLAAGGGRQSALYAAAGAQVTVVDISPAMLALDRQVADQRGLQIVTVEASMDDLGMFQDQSFDLVVHPVSTCYVPDVKAVYREVARVTRDGGLYISQHKQPVSLQSSVTATSQGQYLIALSYYRQGPLPQVRDSRLREEGTIEYLHRWEQLLGEMCRAGFVIEDLLEPQHGDPQAEAGTFEHRSCYVAPYVRVKARRCGASNKSSKSSVWIPS